MRRSGLNWKDRSGLLTGIHSPDKIKTTDDSREVKQSSQHLDRCPAQRKGKKPEEGQWGGEGGGICIRIETLEKAIRRQQIWVLNIYELAALVAFSLSRELPGRVRAWLQPCGRGEASGVPVGRAEARSGGGSGRQGDRLRRGWRGRDSRRRRISPDEEEEG